MPESILIESAPVDDMPGTHSKIASRHPRQIALLRVGIGIWLLFLMAVLYSTGHGGHWAWLLAVGTAVHWVWASFLFRVARRRGMSSSA